MRLYPSPEAEERLARCLMVSSVAFFLFAASALPRENNSAARLKDGPRRNDSDMHPGHPVREESTRQLLFNEIYRRTFTKLKDEKKQFLSPEEAKVFFPGYPQSKRKSQCGGLVTDIPSLVLKFMNLRCPPADLL